MLKNRGIGRQSSRQHKSYLFGLLLGCIYVFDEQINLLVNANIMGSLLYVLATFLFFYHVILFNKKILSSLIALLVAMSIFSLIAYSSSLGCSIELKGAFSLLLLWLVVFAIQIAPLAEIVTWNNISKTVLILVISFVCLDALGIHLLVSDRNAGLFYEPSHLAMYVIPFIAYRFLVSNRDLLSWVTVVVLMLIAPNSTFLVGLVGIFLLWMIKGRHLSHAAGWARIALVSVFIAILLATIDTSSTQERINGILEGGQGNTTDSMSALVWLNGWSQAYEYFAATQGLGVGFNQMGCEKFENVGAFSPSILAGAGTILNSQDGSFMASKLISELGVVGLLLVIFLTFLSIKSIFYINKCDGADNAVALARAVGGMCLLSLLFIRCAGYFQLQVILAFSLLTLKSPKQVHVTNE